MSELVFNGTPSPPSNLAINQFALSITQQGDARLTDENNNSKIIGGVFGQSFKERSNDIQSSFL